MATKWNIREKLATGAVWVIITWIVLATAHNYWEYFFSPTPEPKQCGPHHHIQPIGTHREYDTMVTDYSCLRDTEWACRKAARHLSDREVSDLNCPIRD